MFESISWDEFLLTIAILIIGYYFITSLLLFSSEITSIFKQRKSNAQLDHDVVDQNDSSESNSLMGQARFENRTAKIVSREEKVGAEELLVAPLVEVEEEVTLADVLQENLTHTITDLQQQIKSLAEISASNKKEDCIPLFQSLLSNYPELVGTDRQEQISVFLYNTCKEHCEFHLELNEINSWWPQLNSLSNNNQ